MSTFVTLPSPESALRWLYKLIKDLDPVTTPNRSKESFSQRLLRLRKAKGFTQQQLAETSGISQRMIAHYETRAVRPPANVVPALAQALGATMEEILGIRRFRTTPAPVTNLRLWRRFQKLEKLSPTARKAVLKVLDAYLAQHDLAPSRKAG